jgi:hypothetical protein
MLVLCVAALGFFASAARAASWTQPAPVWEAQPGHGLGEFGLWFSPRGQAIAAWQTTGTTMTGRSVNTGLLAAVGTPDALSPPGSLVPDDASIAGIGIDDRDRATVLVEDREPDPDVPDVRVGVSARSGKVTENTIDLRQRQVLSRKPGIAGLASNDRGDRVAVWRLGSQSTSTGPVFAAVALPGHRFGQRVTITREPAASATVAMNGRGDTAVVWQIGGRVKARIKTARSRGFGKARLVGRATSSSDEADPSVVAVDPAGGVAVAWRRGAPGDLSLVYATARADRAFAAATELDRTGATDVTFTPSIAALGRGRFLVAWAAPQVKAATIHGSRSAITIVDSRPARGLRLATDGPAVAALAWRLSDADETWFAARSPQSGFTAPEIATTGSPGAPSLAIDPRSKTPTLLLGDGRSLTITHRVP